jgi:hypothetical protein
MAEPKATDSQRAAENWSRYEYGMRRGHSDYIMQARICEDFYLGGGCQWTEIDRQVMAQSGRPALEFNQIKNKVNAAAGYQIGNRMDMGFRPRSGAADAATATTLSKLAMQVSDNTQLHFKESEVFRDGLIQQRGFYDLRMSYADTILGEIAIDVLDPMDVIPDPDANSYDPDGWADVTISRLLTEIEIEVLYGTKAKESISEEELSGEVFGSEIIDDDRNSFGDDDSMFSGYANLEGDDKSGRRIRVIDRQYWQMSKCDVIITATGDIRVIEGTKPEAIADMIAAGGVRQKRTVKRVRWLITTKDKVLHDDWSPFNHFTVIPFFPTFRRGKTRGLVDDAIGPQQLLNKSMSSFLHSISTMANSGWTSVAGTLANMNDDELADRGSETGLHIVIKKGTAIEDRPQKIQPNQVPSGIDRFIDRASALLESSTGVNEAMSGNQGNEVSGIAIQTRQFAAQQQLAVPLDNLARTRALLAGRTLEMFQQFYDQPRIIRITETGQDGQENTQEIPLNWPQSDARILNDLTIGEYDVIVTEAPAQITFENSQFLQAIELNEKGAGIPWEFIIGYSNLANKQELIQAMQQQRQAAPVDPTLQAKADLLAAQGTKAQAEAAKAQASIGLAQAQIDLVNAEAVAKSVESVYSAIQTAGVIASQPAVSSLADAILLSSNYKDHDAAPIVPEYSGTVLEAQTPSNTNPLTPANPGVGLNAGIETPAIEGVPA